MNRDFSTATLDYREQLCKEHMRNILYFLYEYTVNWRENIPCAWFWTDIFWWIPKIDKWTDYEGRSGKGRFEAKNVIFLHLGLGTAFSPDKSAVHYKELSFLTIYGFR